MAKTVLEQEKTVRPQVRERRRPPGALAALIGASLLLALIWAFVSPPFQAPDENSHFGYGQTLAETGKLPGDPLRPSFSTEQTLAGSASNADQAAAQRSVKIEWGRPAWDTWLKVDAAPTTKRDDGGGPNPASANPPLYYVFEAGAYLVAGSSDLFGRLLAMRIMSLLWLALTVAAAWALAGEVFRRDRLLQLAASSLAALAPMMTFLSSAVTPDAMLFAAWTTALWLGVRILRRGLTARAAAVLFAVVGLAIVVKAASYALLPAAAFVFLVGLHRRGSLRLKPTLAIGASAAAGLLVTAGAWFVIARAAARPAAAQVSVATAGGANPREFVSYVWQFYLPRLPFMTDFTTVAHTIPVYDVWLKGAWASFGWTEIVFRNRVYGVLAVLSLAVVIIAAIELWRSRAGSDKAIGGFLALATVSLLVGLHWSEYNLLRSGASNFNQGRYLLPLVGVAGIVVALAVRRLAPARRPLAVAGVMGGLLVLQMFSLVLVLQRFYV